jgi:hypothetical protein
VTRTEFAFREVMVGALAPAGDDAGAPVDLELRLAVQIPDLDGFLADPSHAASISGEIRSRALGGTLPLERGDLQLFPGDARGGAEMRYRLLVRATAAEPMTMIGVKTLVRGRVGEAWAHLTEMDTSLMASVTDDGGALLLARGVTRITPIGVVREMTTLRGGARTIARFAWFFGRSVLAAYRPRRSRRA